MTTLKFSQPHFKNLDSFLDTLLNDFPTNHSSTNLNFPPVNILENDHAYNMEFLVPGRKKEDFKITVDKGILTVSFEKKTETKEEDSMKFIKKEHTIQSFKRSFNLDEKIDADKIEAKYEDGILYLTLPKLEEVKVLPKEISIS